MSDDAPTPDVELVFAEISTQISTLCREPLKASDVSWSFAAFDTQLKTTLNDVGCCVLAKEIDDRPADPDTLELDGRVYRRVAPTRHTIMSSLGPVSYLRPRYRCSGMSTSLGPVDENLDLVADYLTGPAAEIGPFMMG